MTRHKKYLYVFFAMIFLIFTITPVYAENSKCENNSHKWVETERISPTESTEGSVTYRCRICGAVYKEKLFPEETVWGEWEIQKEPTCTKPGMKTRRKISGSTQTQQKEIPALGHNYSLIETKEPTCTDVGSRIYRCKICGDTYTEHFGEPKEHNYIQTVTHEPTCTKDGVMMFTCTHCGDSYTNPIPALGHRFGEWIIETPPKEGASGKQYRECTICGERVWEIVPALTVEVSKTFGMTEILITGANIMLFSVLFVLLFGELHLMLWLQRRKKELDNDKIYLDKGDDGYEYI